MLTFAPCLRCLRGFGYFGSLRCFDGFVRCNRIGRRCRGFGEGIGILADQPVGIHQRFSIAVGGWLLHQGLRRTPFLRHRRGGHGLRHGLGTVTRGQRTALGVIFHDAK